MPTIRDFVVSFVALRIAFVGMEALAMPVPPRQALRLGVQQDHLGQAGVASAIYRSRLEAARKNIDSA
jgi:hypothetical protein